MASAIVFEKGLEWGLKIHVGGCMFFMYPSLRLQVVVEWFWIAVFLEIMGGRGGGRGLVRVYFRPLSHSPQQFCMFCGPTSDIQLLLQDLSHIFLTAE